MEAILTADRYLFLLINHLPHTEITNQVAQFFSGVGTWGVVWLGLAVILFLREEKRGRWFFMPSALVMIGTIVSEYVLKWIVARPRPSIETGALIVGNADNFSFPSTHATFAFAFATVLAYEEPKWKRWVYALAVCIALSRVYLGVHYPLDIVAGALLGWLIGQLALRISGKKLSHHRLFLALLSFSCMTGVVFSSSQHTVSDVFATEQYYVRQLFATTSPAAAYKQFVNLYGQSNPSFAHDLAHIAGETLYKQEHISGLQYCTDAFKWGCFHGFMAQAIPRLAGDPWQLCASFSEEGQNSCSHGIGHGLLVSYGYSIAGLERALASCEALMAHVDACQGGVFMEYNTSITSQLMNGQREGQTIEKYALHEPCILLSPQYQPVCYLDQAPRWFSYVSQDPLIIISSCEEVQDRKNKLACFQGIARITPDGKENPQMMHEVCQKISEQEGRMRCLKEVQAQ